MTFWSNGSIDPIRKRNFIVYLSFPTLGGLMEIATVKSVNKPTYETEVNEYIIVNQVLRVPTVPRWSDVTFKFVDTSDLHLTKKLYTLVFGDPVSGYHGENAEQTHLPVNKAMFNPDSTTSVVIEQYDSKKNLLETWSLHNAFIKSINFGDLDYSADEFVEIDVVVAYDYATLNENESDNSLTDFINTTF